MILISKAVVVVGCCKAVEVGRVFDYNQIIDFYMNKTTRSIATHSHN